MYLILNNLNANVENFHLFSEKCAMTAVNLAPILVRLMHSILHLCSYSRVSDVYPRVVCNLMIITSGDYIQSFPGKIAPNQAKSSTE